jgi:hypothetical protein
MKALPSESPKRRGKSRAGPSENVVLPAVLRPGIDALALPHTDWLRHELRIAGPEIELARFAAAAACPGGIPWAYPDLDFEEDDRFLALVNPPDGSSGLRPAAARVLAHEMREAAFQHQNKVRAAAGKSRICPLDLHALVPIPAELLDLGPDDPASIAWLRTHWGVLRALRKVRLVAAGCKKLRGKNAQLTIEFQSADWTPWPAIAASRKLCASWTNPLARDRCLR